MILLDGLLSGTLKQAGHLGLAGHTKLQFSVEECKKPQPQNFPLRDGTTRKKGEIC